jgi:hypothetical protein
MTKPEKRIHESHIARVSVEMGGWVCLWGGVRVCLFVLTWLNLNLHLPVEHSEETDLVVAHGEQTGNHGVSEPERRCCKGVEYGRVHFAETGKCRGTRLIVI